MINSTDLSSNCPLATAQIEAFQRDGMTMISGLASSDEIAAYRPSINAAVKRLNNETQALEERNTYGMALLQTSNLWT